MALSPDGRYAAVSYSAGGGKAGARLVELATGQTKFVTEAEHDGILSAIAWSPDGYTLATAAAGTDKSIKLWDVARLTAPPPPAPPPILNLVARKTETGLTSAPLVLDFVNGGRTLVVADRERVWLRDTASGEYRPAQVFGPALQRAYKGTVAHAAVAPDGKTLALAVHDDAPGATPRLVLWDLVAGKERGTLPTSIRYDALAFRADGRILATATAGEIRFWDLTRPLPSSRVAELKEARVTALAFTPTGTALAVGKSDGTVKLWDTVRERPFWNGAFQPPASVQGLTFSPDGRWLAATTLNQRFVRVWDANTGQVHFNTVGMGQRLAFTSDGRFLAVGSIGLNGTENRRLDVFDLDAKRVVARTGPAVAHAEFIAAVAMTPDGRTIVTGSSDKTLKFWDLPALPR
jgi:WD40 repeat protein